MTGKEAKSLAMFYLSQLQEKGLMDDEDIYVMNFCRRIQALRWWQKAKIMRWLGFIQGYMWTCSHFTIDDLKDHSRSPYAYKAR